MKIIYFSLITLLILSNQSCKKDDPNDRFYWGAATATKNQSDTVIITDGKFHTKLLKE